MYAFICRESETSKRIIKTDIIYTINIMYTITHKTMSIGVSGICVFACIHGFSMYLMYGFIYGSYHISNYHISKNKMKDTLYNRLRYGIAGISIFSMILFTSPIWLVSKGSRDELNAVLVNIVAADD